MAQSFSYEFQAILDEYTEELEEQLEENVHEGSEYMKNKYTSYANSKGWNEYAKGFVVQSYKSKSKTNKKAFSITDYIGNSTRTDDKQKIPIINLLTYGATRKNRGIMQPDDHIERIFKREENNLFKIISKI